VIGKVSPDRILSNDKAKPGDVLILTKPLGLGIITTAAKNGEDKLDAIGDAIRVMTTLNRVAGEEFARCGAHALTDVTGFGLLGHLRNVVAASNVGARIFFERVPVLKAAVEYVNAGISPGGTNANHKFLTDWVNYDSDVTKEEQLILCDAQTSGGLLAGVAANQADAVISSLRARGVVDAVAIGRIESANRGRIAVTR
jgi:selenide,water dikinase